MSEYSVVLNEEELALATALAYCKLIGETEARFTLLDKLKDAFADVNGFDIHALGLPGGNENVNGDVVLDCLSDAKRQRDAEKDALQFTYHGVVRRVANPSIDGRKRLLSGTEVLRGETPTFKFKQYKLDEVFFGY